MTALRQNGRTVGTVDRLIESEREREGRQLAVPRGALTMTVVFGAFGTGDTRL